jgi:hypothetical protein
MLPKKYMRIIAIILALSFVATFLVGALATAPAQAADDDPVASIEIDTDGDGVFNNEDPDIDGDGTVNGQDPDIDGDGLENFSDGDPASTTGIDNAPPPNRPNTWISPSELGDISGLVVSTTLVVLVAAGGAWIAIRRTKSARAKSDSTN